MIIGLACDPSMTWVKLHLELVSNARSDIIMFWCNHRKYESLSTLKVIWTSYDCTFMQLLARVPKFWKTLYLGYLEILQKCFKMFKAFIFSFKWKMYNFFNNDISINNASLHAHLQQSISHVSRTFVCEKDRYQLCRQYTMFPTTTRKENCAFFLEKLHLCFSIASFLSWSESRSAGIIITVDAVNIYFKCVVLMAYRAHWANCRHFKKHCKNPPGHYFRIPKGWHVRTYSHLTVNTAI